MTRVSFATTTIDSGDMVTADELAEGDVVIYTLIDGVYYVDLAETVTETIDARGINSKTETITCDGTDYVQSTSATPIRPTICGCDRRSHRGHL